MSSLMLHTEAMCRLSLSLIYLSWYEWDGKDGEGQTQKNDGSPSRMKAAGFVNAVLFNLHEVVVLYEPHSIKDEESSRFSP